MQKLLQGLCDFSWLLLPSVAPEQKRHRGKSGAKRGGLYLLDFIQGANGPQVKVEDKI